MPPPSSVDLPPTLPAGLRVGSALLAMSALGMLAAPITILMAIPDLTTRPSRHAFAGALGLASWTLCVVSSWGRK